MFAVIDAVARGIVGLMIFCGIIYALVTAVTNPIHKKLDGLLSAQQDLASRITDLERATAEHG